MNTISSFFEYWRFSSLVVILTASCQARIVQWQDKVEEGTAASLFLFYSLDAQAASRPHMEEARCCSQHLGNS